MSNLRPNIGLTIVEDAAKTNALIAYGLMILGMFTGIFWLIGVVWAMVKRDEARETIFADHYANIMTTFWWSLGLSIIGFILAFFVVGYFLLFAVWIWSTFRIIKGLAKITSNKPYHS
ncbi:hypothetical protein E2R68_09700 [Psychromonas sp. RZ22]|uniref:DUF4870 family protein n=1 Tax=Psychromonas algarum TaxID=2555643 RepID=UPI001068B6ED|nr:hypothetical protein [Psychromonas sp. RZ22]TEW54143.1 hypothetical protein E2R68_09700 [Psychromonas sp. RZ22]